MHPSRRELVCAATGLTPTTLRRGALLLRYAAHVPVHLDTPVHRIQWGEGDVRLETPAGTLRADKVLVKVWRVSRCRLRP